MNTSDIFKNLPIDIKEKITEYLIDELEVRCNKYMMIHHLQLIHQFAKTELEDHIKDYPDTFDKNNIIIFMKDFLYYPNTVQDEYGIGFTLDSYNNYLIKREGDRFKKQYYKDE